MIVGCPHCSNRYRLPERLLGSRGARIACPGCGGRFTVLREAAPRSLEAAAPEPALRHGGERERVVALEVVEALAHEAPRMLDAEARGRLFAEAGPRLLEAFDAYRRRAGPAAGSAAFRDALRARWGIDLPGA